jgi:hypothetical protein
MKHYGNTAVTAGLDSGYCAVLSVTHPGQKNNQEEETIAYSTIDGEMINSAIGSDAVKKGKGLFIGDYFVGILDSFAAIGNTPYLRY